MPQRVVHIELVPERIGGMTEANRFMAKTPQKAAILSALLEHYQAELDRMEHAARVAHEAATHEESRAEDAHDTRGLEAAYLAGAQAKRALEIRAIMAGLRSLSSEAHATVSVGSLVRAGGEWLFLVAEGGGVTVQTDGVSVRAIGARSPLGEAIIGLRAQDEAEFETQGRVREIQIESVS